MPMRANFMAFADQKFEEQPDEPAEPPENPPSDDCDSTLTFTEKVGKPKHVLCETRPDGSFD